MKPKNDGNESIIIETKNDSTKSQCGDIIRKNEFYVYALINPIDNLPFYVGKGKNDRDTSHIRETVKGIIPHGNKHLFYSIKKILKSKKSVIVERLEKDIVEKAAFDKEIEYIKKYGRKDLGNGTLTNLTNGGEGQSGWVPDKSYRERMSKSVSGEKNGMYGKSQSQTTIEKIRAKATGRVHTIEVKRKLSKQRIGINNAFYGKRHTEDTKQIIREKSAKFGIDNGCYVNLNPIKDSLIKVYLQTNNFSETTRYANDNGIKCSRVAIKRRLKEWNVT